MTQHPLSKAIRSTAQSHARQHLFPAFGTLRLSSITPELLTEFIRSRTAAGLAPEPSVTCLRWQASCSWTGHKVPPFRPEKGIPFSEHSRPPPQHRARQTAH